MSNLRARGFTIVELMVAMTISLLLLGALVGIFVNSSRSQNEMVKTNGLIEGGRVAMQLLEEDVVHAGYWGGYLPEFDNLMSTAAPGDVPAAIPNPCQPYADWDSTYHSNLIGIPIQSSDTLPVGAGCLAPLAKKAAADVLIVRHADTCIAGVGNCEADIPGKLYFQPSFCTAEKNAGVASAATANSITLGANASTVDNAYVGVMLHTLAGPGAGQYRLITAYDGSTRVAMISTLWNVVPAATTSYAFEYTFGTSIFPLHRRECTGTGTPSTLPITAGAFAAKRKLASNIYYISDFPHPEKEGELIPTLVRSRLDVAAGGTIAQLAPERLIEGVEALRVELGIDDVSDSGAAVDYTAAVNWADEAKTSPTNRGDGIPDRFIRCTAAAPCDVADLTNVVAVKLYTLMRSRDRSPDHKDAKEYCLGEPKTDGTCPDENKIAAANDNYKRHVFTSSIRLTNVSGRRETP